jgi:hypothetical protein
MVCLWTMVYAFPFRPLPLCSVILLLPLFVDIIIYIYINNCVVVFVIVSFIIDFISWRSALLVEETRDLSQVTVKL